MSASGSINYVARVLDLVDKRSRFLNSFTWALPSVIAANIWQMLGFYMIIILRGCRIFPAISMRPPRSTGPTRSAVSSASTLPLLRPSLFLCFVIGMLNSVTSFDLVYVMTAGGPRARH